MKNQFLVACACLFLFAFLMSDSAEKCFAEDDILSSFTPRTKETSKKEEAARAALRKMVSEKKAELNGTSWSVAIDSQAKKGDLLGEDTLIFQNDKFRSEAAEKIGFGSTNYTLTVQEAGPTIWETMQTSKDGTVCFWRGEWKDDVMTGIISRQLKKEGNEEYYFTSASRKEVPKTSEEKEEVQINPAQEAETSAPGVLGGEALPDQPKKASTTDKKKSSWFL